MLIDIFNAFVTLNRDILQDQTYELKRAKENVNFISFNVTLTELRQVLADEETLL